MLAPGERPGMFWLQVAIASGLDPIEFRVRDEPEADQSATTTGD
jgi:hypothetical protein